VTAEEMRATGHPMGLAPCVTVRGTFAGVGLTRDFPEDPAVVVPMAAAAVRGLQSDDLSGPAAVIAAKHFIADGERLLSARMAVRIGSG